MKPLNSERRTTDSSNIFMKKNDTYNKNKREDIQDWKNEHGQPSFDYLQSLARDKSQRAKDTLRSIAGDLDVDYDPNASSDVLIRSILSAAQSDPHSTT